MVLTGAGAADPLGTVFPQPEDRNQFTARRNINPITTSLVVMAFIETGAFPGQQHLGLA